MVKKLGVVLFCWNMRSRAGDPDVNVARMLDPELGPSPIRPVPCLFSESSGVISTE